MAAPFIWCSHWRCSNLHPPPFPEGSSHLAALDLAGCAARQLGDEIDRARHFESGKPRTHEGDDLLLQCIARREALLEHDYALDFRAPLLVRAAHGPSVRD